MREVADKEMCAPQIMRVLGVPISIVDLAGTVDFVTSAAQQSKSGSVLVREVPSMMLAVENQSLLSIHEDALLVVPDGMPLVWIGRLRGCGSRIGRVAGADLMEAVCARSVDTGQSHFFYGGKPGIAEEMAKRLTSRFPGLNVAGCLSPPMRALEAPFVPEGDVLSEIAKIRSAKADFVWIGLSSPKQEFWMTSCIPSIGHGIFFGVGAAFDFHSGAVQRAPLWMQQVGLEWLHRLLSEPRRLWRRYLLLAPTFVVAVGLEEFRRQLKRRAPP